MKLLLLAAVVVCYVAYADAGRCRYGMTCLTCSRQSSMANCQRYGRYVRCPQKNAICQTTWLDRLIPGHKSHDFSSGCAEQNVCIKPTLGVHMLVCRNTAPSYLRNFIPGIAHFKLFKRFSFFSNIVNSIKKVVNTVTKVVSHHTCRSCSTGRCLPPPPPPPTTTTTTTTTTPAPTTTPTTTTPPPPPTTTRIPITPPPEHVDGTCRCYGDPHCITADGFFYNLSMINCGTTFLRDGCSGGIPSGAENYEVAVDIDNVGKRWFVDGVRIMQGGHTLEMGTEVLEVTVDNDAISKSTIEGSSESSPVLQDGFKIYRSATKRVSVEFSGGVIVEWNFNRRVKAMVPSSQAGKVCGICGNYDGDIYNDYVYGPDVHDNDCPIKAQAMDSLDIEAGDSVSDDDVGKYLYGLSWFSYAPNGDAECREDCFE